MTWRSLNEVLDKEIESALGVIGANPNCMPPIDPRVKAEFGAFGAMCLQFLQREKDLSKEVDAACTFFAERHRWPAGSREVGWEVLKRMIAARDLAEFVSCPSLPESFPLPPINADTALLRWALVDYWHNAGLWRWLSRMSADLA